MKSGQPDIVLDITHLLGMRSFGSNNLYDNLTVLRYWDLSMIRCYSLARTWDHLLARALLPPETREGRQAD
jgi:hypothetical protein